MDKILFSSKKQDYGTPLWLYDLMDEEYNFDLDVCANEQNHKCDRYYNEKDNALDPDIRWNATSFCNPPYGRNTIGPWIQKAQEEGIINRCKYPLPKIVCLIPARTDTIWWHTWCLKAQEIRFIKGRIKFIGGKHSATFPSAIIIFTGYQIEYNNPIIKWVDYRGKK